MKRLPNLLSAARLALAPWVIYLIVRHRSGPALAWFLAASITDAFDGWLARRLDAQSSFGQILDPVADKVLVSGAYPALAFAGFIPWWLAWLVLGRDALILLFAAGALAFTKARRSFPPSIWGKLSTIAQMGLVGIVLLPFALPIPLPPLFWITAALTVWSGLDYARRSLR